MKNFNFFFPLFFLFYFSGHSQEDVAKTSIYFELLGNGGAYSLNVERKLTSNFYGRIGFASWSSDLFFEETSIVTFPVMGNMLFGAGVNKLEIGGGVLLGSYKYKSVFGEENDRSNKIFNLTGVVGYRYQKPEGGFMGRVGLTPFLDLTGDEDAYPDTGFFLSGGASIGYSF